MTTTENSPLETARETCILTLNKARAFQAALGVPEDERCSLPKTFKLFRKVERIQALTVEYAVAVDKARAELEARKPVVEAAKPVVLSAGEQMMAKLQEKAATEAARKTCRLAQAEAYRFQKLADVPMEKRCKLPAGFDSFDRAQHEALTAEYVATAEEHRALAEQKAADVAQAKTEAAAARQLAEDSAAADHRFATDCYYMHLEELARKCGIVMRVHPLHYPDAGRLSYEKLRTLLNKVLAESKRLEDEAQAAKTAKLRTDYERQQKLLKSYNDARRSGREGRSFNAWMASQGRGAMRRTG
jgi:hypothetical protein